MKLILSVLAGIIFIVLVFLYARAITQKYNKRIDSIARHYGYRNYKHMAKEAEKKEQIILRQIRIEQKFKREEWLRRHGM